MHRRTFLQATAAAALAAGGLTAAEPKAKFRLGFSLYGMRDVPLTKAIDAVAEIGYTSIELATMPGWHGDPAKLNAAARKAIWKQLTNRKVSVNAFMDNLSLDVDAKTHTSNSEKLKADCDLVLDVIEDSQRIIETTLGGKAGTWDEVKNQFRDRLGDWIKVAKSYTCRIAIKPHRFGAVNLPEHALWLLDQLKSNALQVVFDWSHYEQRELKFDETLKALLPHTVFIHVKDTKVTDGKAEFLLPGEGKTDYKAYFKTLTAAGYKGAVCAEVSGMIHNKKDYDGIAAAKKCFAVLKAAKGE